MKVSLLDISIIVLILAILGTYVIQLVKLNNDKATESVADIELSFLYNFQATVSPLHRVYPLNSSGNEEGLTLIPPSNKSLQYVKFETEMQGTHTYINTGGDSYNMSDPATPYFCNFIAASNNPRLFFGLHEVNPSSISKPLLNYNNFSQGTSLAPNDPCCTGIIVIDGCLQENQGSGDVVAESNSPTLYTTNVPGSLSTIRKNEKVTAGQLHFLQSSENKYIRNTNILRDEVSYFPFFEILPYNSTQMIEISGDVKVTFGFS